MRYVLRKAVLGKVPEIEITEENYLALQNAREVLTNALAIEEKYEILICNYLEFEKQILNDTAYYMVRSITGYSDFFDVRLALNVRLVNLLTSARLYIDQLKRHVSGCVPVLKEEIIKALFSKEYDGNPEYRFMENLRNHVQHRGLPIHWVSQGGSWTEAGENGFLEYSTEFASRRSFLEEDGGFKQSVLQESDDKIDLKKYTRCYIESIGNIHDSARKIIAEPVSTARELLQDAHSKYKAISNESLAGLSVYALSEAGTTGSFPILLDWDDIRIELQKRNRKAINLKKRYVTGKGKTDSK
ncbi:MAG: hypothetical protein L0H94_06250 [Nitrospira sp.]|nr:hypothetical protein [Nitrospira sp.]